MDAEFYAFLRYLRKHHPDPRGKPIYVRTRRMVKNLGTLNYDGYESRIYINKKQEHATAIDSLIHEWAHVLDGGGYQDNRKEEHRVSWGRYYAKLYQAYVRFLNEQGLTERSDVA